MPTQTIQRMFDDLLNLEVNVIVKPNMTARKMPLTGEAFHDVATEYRTCLDRQAERLGHDFAEHAHREIDDDRVLAEHFECLCADAHALRRANAVTPLTDAAGEDEGADVILKRMERNSEQLVRIMREHAIDAVKERRGVEGATYVEWLPVVLDSKEDLLVLRKAWEVGVESVVMQTVAQIDGDIVTRVQQSRIGADDAPLHHVHMSLVSSSLEHWRFLFATVASFTLGVFQSFFG